ncbi:MAG: multidrug effflux MFS transporter [Hyphomicrobiaceae bacterium]|nr:multidrug effflux MFS transporter [Hyphomicrobiaceae bacterium]
MLMALTALSIDIMLPALPQIAAEYRIASDNDRQLVVFGYLIGSGPGQILFGPLSDRWGRRPVMLIGLGIYLVASALALFAPSFGWLLAARALQGFGAAAPRTVMLASVRDLFRGAQMARVMSLIMTVFLIVPVIAPAIGQALISVSHWKAPFYFLFGFGVVAFIWASRRLPETWRPLPPGVKRVGLGRAFVRVVTTRQTMAYLLASGFMLGCLMSYIASSQQIFVEIYGMGPWFPLAFAGTAAAMIAANFINARIVLRFGPRRVSHMAVVAFLVVALTFLVTTQVSGRPPAIVSWIFLALLTGLFGLTAQNFNALAMEPQGEIAGMAASILGTYTTLAGALFGWLVARAFDGTVAPIAAGFSILAGLTILTILAAEGRLALPGLRPRL